MKNIILILMIVNIISWGYYFRPSPVYSNPKPPKTTVTPIPTVFKPVDEGVASFYSVSGCVGCNEKRIMANREILDDTKLTVAYNRAPLNSHIEVKCKKTGRSVRAKVTDRGGFERLGRIIDLSVATKNAIGCGGLCKVEVIKL